MGGIYYNSNGVITDGRNIKYVPEPIPLTYPGSTHTEEEVITLGGTVFTITDEGEYFGKTIGIFLQNYNNNTLDIPSGWALAEGVNGKYYHVRDLTYTDYCNYNFATYTDTLGIVNWPNSNFGYYGDTYFSRYLNCSAASSALSPRSNYWTIYYLDSPYTIRALNVTTWVLGTNTIYGHPGHEIYAFGAF